MTDPTAKFYVSVRDGPRYGLLLGPFDTVAEARLWVRVAANEACRLHAIANFYAYGTCKATRAVHQPGKLNYLLEQGLPPKPAPALLENRKVAVGDCRYLCEDPTHSLPFSFALDTVEFRIVGLPVDRARAHCVWIEPVAPPGRRPDPLLIALRLWEAD